MLAPMPVSSRLVLGTGLGCHLLSFGDPGADHVVLCLHGFLDLAWTFRPVIEPALLSPDLYVVAPDLRGHGDSDPIGPGGYYHFMDYVADVDALVDQLLTRPGQRLSVVGHSMGGMIAGYFAGAFPDRVHRLALLEGLGPPEDATPMPDRVRAWLAGWRRVRASQAAGPQRQSSYASVEEAAQRLRHHDPRLPEALALELAEHGTRLHPDGRRRFKHDPLHLTRGPYPFVLSYAQTFWRQIACPVLLVDAEHTDLRYAPEDQARRVACFRDVRAAVVPDAGHMMQRHQPAVLGRLLADFLR